MVTKGSVVTIVPYCVDNRLVADFDLEHGGTQDMTSIVSLDLQVRVHLSCHTYHTSPTLHRTAHTFTDWWRLTVTTFFMQSLII